MKKILIAIPMAFLLMLGIAQASPLWKDNETSVASGSAWDCTRTYGFEINWTESVGGFSNATFQLGKADGSMTNYTTATTPAVQNTSMTGWYINFTQLQLGPVGTYNFTWFAVNTTAAENSTDTWTYTVVKTTPNLRANFVNDTYININQSFLLTVNLTDDSCWYKYNNFTVIATVQRSDSSKNFTMVIGTDLNYTYNFSLANLGDTSDNCTRVNITKIYTIGNANYSTVTNTSTLYCDFGTTSALTVTAPTSLDYQQSATFKTNYTTTEGNLVMDDCALSFINSYDLDYSSGYQQVSFASPHTFTGTQPYSITCSNSSYQTQTASGSVTVRGAGGSGGGGGATTTTTTTTLPVKKPLCGNDVCESGESFWNCWKDCGVKLSTGTSPTTTVKSYQQEASDQEETNLSPLLVVIIIVVLIWLVKKK